MKLIPRIVNRVIAGALLLLAVYSLLLYLFDAHTLIVLLNGALAGSLCALVFSFHELILQALVGIGKYDRIRQMTLGFAICWLVIAIWASTSIYINYYDKETLASAYASVAFARYLAVIAAWLQITAPDFGLGLFHGRDRKVLIGSISIGTAVAFAVVMMQGGVTEGIM